MGCGDASVEGRQGVDLDIVGDHFSVFDADGDALLRRIHSPKVSAVFTYWRGLRKDGRIPSSVDIDPAAIKVPTLLWHGENDVFSPVSHARWLRRRIPGTELGTARMNRLQQQVSVDRRTDNITAGGFSVDRNQGQAGAVTTAARRGDAQGAGRYP